MTQIKGMEAGEAIDLKQLLKIFWKRKWLILICLVLSQILVFMKYVRSPIRYAVESKFIFKSGGAESPMSNIAAIVGIRAPAANNANISNFFEIILYTDEFLAKVIDKKWKVGSDSLDLKEFWKMPADTAGENFEYLNFRRTVGKLVKGEYIIAGKDVRSGLVTLITRFESPEITYAVNSYIVERLNDYLLNNTQTQASENRKFVEKRVAEVGTELRSSEDVLLGFNIRNQSVTSPALLLEMARLRRNVEVNQEIYLQLKKQLELAKIDERKENPVIELISKPQYPLAPDARINTKSQVVITLGGLFFGIFLSLFLEFVIGNSFRPFAKRSRA